jgi:hypothetical protein
LRISHRADCPHQEATLVSGDETMEFLGAEFGDIGGSHAGGVENGILHHIHIKLDIVEIGTRELTGSGTDGRRDDNAEPFDFAQGNFDRGFNILGLFVQNVDRAGVDLLRLCSCGPPFADSLQ